MCWMSGFEPQQDKEFIPHHSDPLGSSQPPIQWVPRSIYCGVKWSGHEADHSLPCSARVICLHGIVLYDITLLDCHAQSIDRLCGLVVRVLGYSSGGPGSIPGTTRKKSSGLELGPLSLVSTTEELLDRKVAAPF
jgi:hypothetical protein